MPLFFLAVIGILSLLVGIIPFIHDERRQDANTQPSVPITPPAYNFSGPVYFNSPPTSPQPVETTSTTPVAPEKDTTLVPEFLPYKPRRYLIAVDIEGNTTLVPESLPYKPDVLTDARTIQQHEEEEQVVPTFTYLEEQVYNYLRERAGRICSRDEIKRAVWKDELPSDSALQKIIERIRTKIEPDAKNPQYLVVVRGQGYVLRNTVSSK